MRSGDSLPGALPSGTELSYSLSADTDECCVQLRIEVNSEVQIVNIIAIDLEGNILDGSEVLAITPLSQGRIATFPLRPLKNQPCLLRIQTHLASRLLSTQLHVFESEIKIPRFSGYKVVDDNHSGVEPNSQVTIRINESVSRLAGWITSGFLLPYPIQPQGDKMKICFISVCRKKSNSMNGTYVAIYNLFYNILFFIFL
jgi:hypothetical protein